MGAYRISELAEVVGVPATTLRYYETQGLLPTRRDPNGYRTYDDHDVDRVRFVVTAKALGLPLVRIRDLVGVWQDGMCRDVRDRLLPLVADQLDDLDGRMRDLRASRAQLVAAQDRLAALPARDTPCDPECAFLGEHQEPAIACALSGGDYAARVRQWRDVLTGTTSRHVDGGAVRTLLPVDRLPDLTALIVEETRCCPFLTFTLTVTGDGVRLDVTAPDDARPLLDELFPDAASCPC